jgi:transaldolase
MKIFLDSSKVDEAKKWMPVIDGATTNPSILLKDGTTDIYEFCRLLHPKSVSIEACGDFETDARKYREIPNAVIKVPLLDPTGGDNLEVIKALSGEGIPINCTALMSLSQVILATKCGARYVSLFAGRVDDEGGDYFSMIADCVDFLNGEDTKTELIVGSIRTVGNVLDAVRAGAHIVTIPPAILEKMLLHRFSLETVKQFEEDHRRLSR